jgi:hypothetical protein
MHRKASPRKIDQTALVALHNVQIDLLLHGKSFINSWEGCVWNRPA